MWEKEIKKNEQQKEEIEKEIKEVEKKIEAKEKELEELLKEVEVLEDSLIDVIVGMEGGKLSKKERAMKAQEQKKMEIRKLDLETVIDGKKHDTDEWEKKRDLEEEVYIISEYIRNQEEEEVQEKRQRNDSDDNDEDDSMAKKQKMVSISRTVPNCTKLYQTYFFFFFMTVLFFIFAG